MAQQSSHLKKLHAKIFGQPPEPGKDAKPGRAFDPAALTINIPNSALAEPAQPGPVPPQMPRGGPESAGDDADSGSFRRRLAEKQGADYHGAERFRLEEDDARKCHWKRWGPYLSDRQWVCFPCFLRLVACWTRFLTRI